MVSQKRTFNSPALALFCVWALVCVFIHSFHVSETSITRKYLNVYLLSEGAIYILTGCTFLYLAITKSKNLKFVWALIPFTTIPFLFEYISRDRMAPAIAVIVGVFIYLVISRKMDFLYTGILLTIGLIVWQWPIIIHKSLMRLALFREMISKVMEHPFVGGGFDRSFNYPNMVLVNPQTIGWIYCHNDFLNIAMRLGIPALILTGWFMCSVIKQSKKTTMIIPAITILILCNIQMTAFDIGKASVILMMIALIIIHNQSKGAVQ